MARNTSLSHLWMVAFLFLFVLPFGALPQDSYVNPGTGSNSKDGSVSGAVTQVPANNSARLSPASIVDPPALEDIRDGPNERITALGYVSVKEFQDQVGLVVDGIIGPKTLAALVEQEKKIKLNKRSEKPSSGISISDVEDVPTEELKKSFPDSTLYVDKNRYFQILPPEGWQVKEYQDPRSKVAFFLEPVVPGQTATSIHVLCRPLSGPTDIKADAEDTVAQLKRTGAGDAMVKMVPFAGAEAAKVEGTIVGSGVQMKVLSFKKFGRKHTIGFTAMTHEFSKYEGIVEEAISTFKCIPPNATALQEVRNDPIGREKSERIPKQVTAQDEPVRQPTQVAPPPRRKTKRKFAPFGITAWLKEVVTNFFAQYSLHLAIALIILILPVYLLQRSLNRKLKKRIHDQVFPEDTSSEPVGLNDGSVAAEVEPLASDTSSQKDGEAKVEKPSHVVLVPIEPKSLSPQKANCLLTDELSLLNFILVPMIILCFLIGLYVANLLTYNFIDRAIREGGGGEKLVLSLVLGSITLSMYLVGYRFRPWYILRCHSRGVDAYQKGDIETAFNFFNKASRYGGSLHSIHGVLACAQSLGISTENAIRPYSNTLRYWGENETAQYTRWLKTEGVKPFFDVIERVTF